MLERFNQFLIYESAKEAFYWNRRLANASSEINDTTVAKGGVITRCGFAWSDSDEGEMYWYNLSKKWHIILSEL